MLKRLDYRAARWTIAKTLKEHNIKPRPERDMSWRTFLRSHADVIAGADFFTADAATTGAGAVRNDEG